MAFYNRAINHHVAFKSLTAATTLTASDSGKTLGLALAAGFTVTLPSPAQGLHFKFIVTVNPTGDYLITSGSGTNIIHGTTHSSTGGNADSTADTAVDVITLAHASIVIGDRVDMVCDGTYWYATAFCDADAGITYD